MRSIVAPSWALDHRASRRLAQDGQRALPACDQHAQVVAARSPLRSLDALHLASFSLARREIEGLEFLTADERLREVAESD
jgi:predicted nucleic acid-binding protein